MLQELCDYDVQRVHNILLVYIICSRVYFMLQELCDYDVRRSAHYITCIIC